MRLVVAVMLIALLLAAGAARSAVVEVEGPQILVRISNDGDDLTARLLAWEGDDPPFFDERIPLRGDELTLVPIDAPPGEYQVRLELPFQTVGPAPTPLDPVVPLEADAWTHGCPGPYALDFDFALDSHVSVSSVGCLVLTDAFTALLVEAKSARADFPRTRIHVPLPGGSDRGVYDHGGEMPFEWNGDTRWLDAWGRDVRGAEVTYKDNTGSGKGVARLFAWNWAEASGTMELFRFAAGETSPSSWTRTDPRFAEGGAGGTSVALAREVRYDEAQQDAACYLRHALQGRDIRAGDVIAAATLCRSWDGPDWRAAAPIEWRGLRALPLYRTEETPELTRAERVLLVDGIPYLVHHERHVLLAGEGVRVRHATLDRVELRGAPIAADAASMPPPSPRLAPLDPLRGPADGQARLGFPLREASDAARSDPLLASVRAVTERPDSVLAGAAYVHRREAGEPVGRESWFLMYRAGDALAYAVCERASTPLPLAAPPRCHVPGGQQWRLYEWAEPLWDAPPMTRADLPVETSGFDEAFARWDALRPDGPAAKANFALYRAWSDEELGEPAFLAVGISPQRGVAPSSAPTMGDYTALGLDGATFAAVELTQTRGLFVPTELAPLGENSVRGDPAGPRFGDDLSYLAGGGVALGLIGLLAFLLYSRLVRARVLDDATRARIHGIVAQEPGVHASALLDRLGKRSGVGEYHLGVLAREGFLACVVTPGFRRYFLTGLYTPAQMRAMAALREGRNDALYALICANPGIRLASLAEKADVSLPYASKSVARLAEAGLVLKMQAGRAVEIHPLEDQRAGRS